MAHHFYLLPPFGDPQDNVWKLRGGNISQSPIVVFQASRCLVTCSWYLSLRKQLGDFRGTQCSGESFAFGVSLWFDF